jgi:hypothetical protein
MLAGVSSGTTVMTADAVTPPDDAEIVAVPAATPVTTPADDTVAMLGAEVLQLNVAPGTSAPFLSRADAVYDVVAPMVTVLAPLALMATVAMPEVPVGSPPEPPQASREAKMRPRTIAGLMNRPRDTAQGNVAPHSREPWRETAPRDGRIALETSSASGGMSTRRQSAIFPKIHPVRRRR